MSLELNEVVRLLESSPSEGLSSGSPGVIIAVFSEPEEAYEIDFCDEEGVTIAQLALRQSQFEVVK
ncbi:DUF4926 domain-containing protein [Metapseudomonas otitidis]|uniref:DUF4926 domain-containing protein n=1 Tax=Metapseudomonas otitidis TaxID=319939 RepID=UPI000D1A1764